MTHNKTVKDEFLFTQLKEGDAKAFELLFKRHYSSLCRKVNSMIDDEEASEDVVQQLFIKIWESRETLDTPNSVIAYLITSSRNRALNYIKSLNRKSENEMVLTNHSQEEDHYTIESIDARELQRVINEAIEQLPEKRKEVFILSRFEGKSYKEIAEILQISVKTVEAQMSKALASLREHIRHYKSDTLLFLMVAILLFL